MNRLNYYEDYKEIDFVDELLKAIENDCEREIMRIVKLDEIKKDSFSITVIFTDYILLEAYIKISKMEDSLVFQVNGNCY